MANTVRKAEVKIFIDGTAVDNSVKAIREEMRRTTNEMANMIKGSDEYIAAGKKYAQLNKVLQEHKDYVKEIENQYSKTSNAAGGFIEKIKKQFGALTADFAAFFSVNKLISSINSALREGERSYLAFIESQAKLTQVMRNTMNARQDEIESIIELTNAQQKVGVINRNVQLSGAQELSTYLTKSDTLKQLIPVMNDMVAQQFGINASQEQAATVASMLGKVMNGQVGALKRYGYGFDEAQEKILKFGTESERAAVLTDVITSSVGGVNEALAKTPEGKIKAAAIEYESVREEIGELVTSMKAKFIPIQTESMKTLNSFIKNLIELVKWLNNNKSTLLTLSAAWGTYLLAVNRAIIADKLKVFWTNNVSVALNKLWLTMKANPWGVLLAAATVFITYFRSVNRELTIAQQKQKTLNDINAEANKNIASQVAELDRLLRIARDENRSKAERLEAIKKINEISPEHLGNLTLEEISTNKVKAAIDKYRKSLLETAKAKAAFNKIVELEQQKIDLQNKTGEQIYEENTNAWQRFWVAMANGFGDEGYFNQVFQKAYQKQENAIKSINAQIEALSETASKTSSDTDIPVDTGGSEGNTGGGDVLKERIQAIEKEAALRRIAAMQAYEDQKSFEEELLKIEKETIEKKQALYKEGSNEYVKYHEELAKIDLKATQDKEKAERERQEKIKALIEKYDKEAAVTDEQKKQRELDYLDSLYEEKLRMTEEYLKLKQAIEDKYDPVRKDNLEKAQQLVSDNPKSTNKKGDLKSQLNDDKLSSKQKSKMIDSAQEAELAQLDALQALHDAEIDAIIDYEELRLSIEKKYADLRETNDKEAFDRKIKLAQFAIEQMNTLLSAYSSYVQASQDAEVAAVEAKYDKQIKAAGKNQKKVEKLEKQKEKELAKVRAEYQEKSFAIQIAQAFASTAMATINAYSSAAAIPVVGTVLAPIAAGVAFAAGMFQVAAIKKQREAAKASYSSGGYTPAGRWDEPQGVVHSDEFVANRFATGNPMLRPVFDVIDYAQRNNTINSIGKNDIARALGVKGFDSGGYVNQTVNNNNTQELNPAYIEALIAVIDRLDKKLDEPFVGEVSITGRRGIAENMNLYDRMIKNASRS